MIADEEPHLANGDAANGNFSLPIAVRKGLSYLMPLHPLAALLTLIAFGLAVGSHFSKNFNSARYFLALFLVSLFALVFSTIIFIVDILAFHPDLGFAIWLVMVATIFLLITVLFTFARRRAILNRIEHQRRVDINPEMNGFNHAQTKKLEADAIAARGQSR